MGIQVNAQLDQNSEYIVAVQRLLSKVAIVESVHLCMLFDFFTGFRCFCLKNSFHFWEHCPIGVIRLVDMEKNITST